MATDPIVYVPDTRPTMHYGSGAPSDVLGADGDTYLDVTDPTLYGPKTSGAWGSGTGLTGPTGATGATGATGGSGGIPVETGMVVPFAGLTLPANYLWCNGAAQLKATYVNLWAALNASIGAVTVTIASPTVFTLAAHGLAVGDGVYFTTTGALPTGFTIDTSYYVTAATANTFSVAATRGGTVINSTGSQSGIHTVYKAPFGGVNSTQFAVPDLQGGRVPVGLDNLGGTDSGTLTVGNALGATAGAENITLTQAQMAAHTHTVTDPGHVHNLNALERDGADLGGTNRRAVVIGGTSVASMVVSKVTGVTVDSMTGGGSSHSNMQPYTLINYIIKIYVTDSPLATSFVQARLHKPRTQGGVIWLIIHDMESPEYVTSAESCQRYFESLAAKGSAHYCVDVDSIGQSVYEREQAAGAPGANQIGIHVEFAGQARQLREEWLDDYSLGALRRGAALFADLCDRKAIPPRYCTDDDIRAKRPGITSHAQLTRVLGTAGGHTDPGPEFPYDIFLGLIQGTTLHGDDDVNKPAILLRHKDGRVFNCPNNGENLIAVHCLTADDVATAKFFGSIDKTNFDGTPLLRQMASYEPIR